MEQGFWHYFISCKNKIIILAYMKIAANFLMSVLEQCPSAIAIFDSKELNIAFVSQGMLDIWCVDRSILGRSFCACFPNFKEEGFSSILKNVWKTGIVYQAEDTPAYIVHDGTKILRYFNFEYRPLLDEDGKTYAIMHTVSDVTGRHLAYKNVKEKQEQLMFSRELDVLASTLAHDLKNPLSVLKIGNSFLSKNVGVSVKVSKKWFETFAASIQNIESIINQTLQLGKIRRAEKEVACVAMDKKIGNCIDEIKLVYPDKHMEFVLGDLFPLYTDCGIVYQVFINLIGNAVKYAKKSGEAFLHIYSEKADKGVVYYIEDNGIGIPGDELQKVFLTNERASNTAKVAGTGIGLALVKHLMEHIDGTIHLSSELNKGTVVRLFFPVSSR